MNAQDSRLGAEVGVDVPEIRYFGHKCEDDRQPEVNFWHWAYQVAAFTGDKWASYESLKRQWQGIRPDASHVEYEAAMNRIADMLRV